MLIPLYKNNTSGIVIPLGNECPMYFVINPSDNCERTAAPNMKLSLCSPIVNARLWVATCVPNRINSLNYLYFVLSFIRECSLIEMSDNFYLILWIPRREEVALYFCPRLYGPHSKRVSWPPNIDKFSPSVYVLATRNVYRAVLARHLIRGSIQR